MPRANIGLKKADFQDGKLLRTDIGGKSIVIGMANGKLYAMDSVCSHEGGPLEDGTLEAYNLTCPWHQGIFDIRNAKASPETSWVTDLKSYPIVVDEKSGEISIETAPNDDIAFENNNKYVTGQGTEVLEEKTVLSKPLKLQLKLLEKIPKKGTDVMSFKFSRIDDENHLNYRAGQYAIVDLGTKEDPKGPLRSFTMASSPTENVILITTRIRDSPFKKKLASLNIESTVTITSPLGQFVLPDDHSTPVVFLSGGIGVTPFRSMIKYATDNHISSKITMFDSNRNVENTLFKEEFDDCLKNNSNLRIVYTITEKDQSNNAAQWKGERGYINESMVTKYLTRSELENSIFYICGPPGMLTAMEKMLKDDLHIPKERIKVEEFTGY
jgi:ferredoxin-NADP reductase/nitrite reductase/ring-hydroxylating ferredoxin subunit